MIDEAEVKRRFTHHAPGPQQAHDHHVTRRMFHELASDLRFLPEGREKSLAYTSLEESSFWAHAAIAREVE